MTLLAGLSRSVTICAAVAATAGFAISGCGLEEDTGSSGSSNGGSNSSKSEKKDKGCGTRATDDCTPSVGPNGSVRVDALRWRVKNAEVAKTIGDPDLFGAKADGVFVIVTLQATSKKSESATLTDNAFQLETKDGKTYDTDSDGTVAALGGDTKPLFLEDIGPDSTVKGKVVYDVPKGALKKNLRMRFNELGFGSTHGYIALNLN